MAVSGEGTAAGGGTRHGHVTTYEEVTRVETGPRRPPATKLTMLNSGQDRTHESAVGSEEQVIARVDPVDQPRAGRRLIGHRR